MKERNIKKTKRIFIVLLCILVGLSGAFLLVKIMKDNKESDKPFGVWWWDDELDVEKYLNFAEDNEINEIYYCTGKFNEKTKDFIRKANENDIDVYWLVGECKWIEDSLGLKEEIDDYVAYQRQYPDAQFDGIHLDIEPHQNPEFEANRYQLIYGLIELASELKETYPTIKFDYDLPFWLHDEITYDGQAKPAYEHMIDIANRIFIMSYRDTVDAILDISKEEIAYADQQKKPLVLCVETYSNEGDKVSFGEEGKQVMQEEIRKLRQEIPEDYGISIHHIRTWYELKD